MQVLRANSSILMESERFTFSLQEFSISSGSCASRQEAFDIVFKAMRDWALTVTPDVGALAGGGYALGLKTKEIGRRWGQLERTQDFVLRRVIYEVDLQRALLCEVIDKTMEALTAGTQGVSVTDANNAIARCCQFVRAEVADYLISFKHPAFAIEEEWRICHVISPGQEDHVLFRDGQFGLTPYVCLDISPMAGVNHNKLPLARITHGPVPSPDNVRFALNKLLRAKNYAFVEVAGSTLPVRVGA